MAYHHWNTEPKPRVLMILDTVQMASHIFLHNELYSTPCEKILASRHSHKFAAFLPISQMSQTTLK